MIIIKNGALVTPQGLRRADLAMEGDKIVRIAVAIEPGEDDTVEDATDCWVFPGFIDGHTHMQCWTGMDWTADSFETGTRAAACGGTTTIVDYATADRGVTMPDALAEWHRRADGTCTANYAFHMALAEWNERNRADLSAMREAGVSSFKTYFAYDHLRLDDAETLEVLEELKRVGGMLCVHCENGTLVNELQKRVYEQGIHGPEGHALSRPDVCEAEAVSRLLRIAEAVDIPVVIVHLTNAAALREVEAARKRGQKVYAETCPQYLLLDEHVYFDPDYSSAARYVCAPPLRAKEEQDRLWKALRRGEIQTISTDHCSFTLAQKELGREDFTRIPGGLPGVETRGELIYSYGVAKRRISAARMCRCLSENPARLYGLFPRKGILRPGSDADIVVYDPTLSHVIRAEDCVANVDYNPYEGFATVGGIRQVWLRGQLSVSEGKVLAETPAGRYMARGKNSL